MSKSHVVTNCGHGSEGKVELGLELGEGLRQSLGGQEDPREREKLCRGPGPGESRWLEDCGERITPERALQKYLTQDVFTRSIMEIQVLGIQVEFNVNKRDSLDFSLL